LWLWIIEFPFLLSNNGDITKSNVSHCSNLPLGAFLEMISLAIQFLSKSLLKRILTFQWLKIVLSFGSRVRWPQLLSYS
jgi:hypothetical protein